MRRIVLSALAAFSLASFATPCTTAIINGKHTASGRPLLWKHRDSGFEQNVVRYFSDGRFAYIGLLNAADRAGLEVWAGVNAAGFAIMNSASYNLKPPTDTTSLADREGFVMKLALQNCATLDDFERMLDTLAKPLGVEANFGVIDGEGGCAYYETTNFGWRKIDANDPAVAPHGYVIRTNYSAYGARDEGYGYIRHLAAEKLFHQAAAIDGLSAPFLLQTCSRSLDHALTGVDLREEAKNGATWRTFQDFIPRSSSVSTVVVEGVRTDEPGELATMWTILGFPLTSVATAHWTAGGDALPDLLSPNESGVAPLCELSLALKSRLFPITRGSGERYIRLPALLDSETGVAAPLAEIEEASIARAEEIVERNRREGFDGEAVAEYYAWIDEGLFDLLRRAFPEEAASVRD
ncbi:MAG: hypothetical protein GF419_14030 [Ignavibacteriales bacterium]|nr:hypothetical protein [Ignavibacteriales bacterium]